MNFWATTSRLYNSAAINFDEAVATRAFAFFFIGLACLIAVVGLAADLGLAISQTILPIFIAIAFCLWSACFALKDNRFAIQNWFREKLTQHSPLTHTIPSSKSEFNSAQPHSEVEPPRTPPRANNR